jgi:hypothetical protein
MVIAGDRPHTSAISLAGLRSRWPRRTRPWRVESSIWARTRGTTGYRPLLESCANSILMQESRWSRPKIDAMLAAGKVEDYHQPIYHNVLAMEESRSQSVEAECDTTDLIHLQRALSESALAPAERAPAS